MKWHMLVVYIFRTSN